MTDAVQPDGISSATPLQHVGHRISTNQGTGKAELMQYKPNTEGLYGKASALTSVYNSLPYQKGNTTVITPTGKKLLKQRGQKLNESIKIAKVHRGGLSK